MANFVRSDPKNLQISDTHFEGSCHLIFADFCSCLNLGTFTTPFPIFSCTNDFRDIQRVDACLEIGVQLPWRVIAKVITRLGAVPT